MYFCQCASWKGKENQAPYRLTSTIIDLALFLDYNARQALKINAQEDHLRIRAGKLKCDRSATYGFWGAHVSISSDILVLIDSCRELWEFLPYSIITPPDAYHPDERYHHYQLTVGDSQNIRTEEEGYVWMRCPHEGAFGTVLEVCVINSVSRRMYLVGKYCETLFRLTKAKTEGCSRKKF